MAPDAFTDLFGAGRGQPKLAPEPPEPLVVEVELSASANMSSLMEAMKAAGDAAYRASGQVDYATFRQMTPEQRVKSLKGGGMDALLRNGAPGGYKGREGVRSNGR